MSRFHQRLNEDLQDAEFAEAFYDMSADIAVLQVLEEAHKAYIEELFPEDTTDL